MLNILWPAFIIISVIYACFTGNINNVNESIIEWIKKAVELTITFFGITCFWTGIMKIAQETSLTKKISKILRPIINFLFSDIKHNEKAKEEISMNMVANILGLGNAATPLGLNAMKTLQKDSNDKSTVTPSMAMFIIINTASIQLIPTTAIAIRASLNSENPSKIILPVWIATIVAFIAATLSAKLFIFLEKQRHNKRR